MNLNKLSRNYEQCPLGAKELIPVEDLKYLYLELNLCFEDISSIVNKSANSISKQCKKAGLQKTKEQKKQAIENRYLRLFGVKNPAQLETSKNKQKATFKQKDWTKICNKRKQTSIKKYGVDNPAKSKEIQEKIKYTNQQKYGVDYVTQNSNIRQKQKDSMLQRYGVQYPYEHKQFVEKAKQTCLSKYNESNIMKTPQGKEKLKQTIQEKYNCDNIMKDSQYKQKQQETCIKKYGENNPFKVEQFKQKAIKTLNEKYGVTNASKCESIQQKKVNTLQGHYGVDNAFKCPKIQEKTKQYYMDNFNVNNPMQIKEIQRKAFETKKKNNSFGTSKAEKLIFDKLLNLFPDTVTQYSTDIYPYPCDFYIPCLDLFIEYQGFMTHGSEPFDATNIEHQQILQEWKEKCLETNFKGIKKIMYENAIKVWTITDPHKRQIVKENNLNWLEFFTLEEFNAWYEDLIHAIK